MEILFVCSGNTCRSAMAEALARELIKETGIEDIEVFSAGVYASTGDPASFGAMAAMDEMGADLHLHRTTQLHKGHIEAADLILCMGCSHKRSVLSMAPQAADKTQLLLSFAAGIDKDIDDPFGGDAQVYRACAHQIGLAVAAALAKLRPDKASRIQNVFKED